MPTYSSTTEEWYNPSLTGSQQGPGNDTNGTYTGNGFLPALTAACYKGKITEHYYGANATGNNHGARFASYWSAYNTGSPVTVSVNNNDTFTFNDVYSSYPQTAANNTYYQASKNYVNGKDANGNSLGYTGGIAYNDGYFSATQTDEINGIFEVVFDEITFPKAGTYTLTVVEVDTGDKEITYDETEFTVTVAVTDDGKGKLTAEVTYPDGGVTFVNAWEEIEDPGDPSPDTGDDFSITMMVTILVVSAAAVILLLFLNKKKKKDGAE